MKYWVYKDSRILGPFDKDAVTGLPGVDSFTLVSAGESAAAEGDWRPAGEVSEFSALPLDRGSAWPTDDLGSAYGLLDKLQIESAGLIADDEFPDAAADLFQDADMKKTFGDLLAPRPSGSDEELRRARDRAAELTAQLETLYQRVSELEAGQTNLLHRLAEKEMLLRRQPAPAASPDVEAFLRETAAPAAAPASAPPAAAPSAPAAPPPVSAPPNDWPSVVPGGEFPSFPSRAGGPAAPAARFAPPPIPPPAPPPEAAGPASAPVPPAPPPLVPEAFAPSAPFLPAAPAGAAFPPPVPPPGAPEAAPPPKKSLFERKSFKIVPTVKAFRVVGAEDIPVAGSAATPGSAPELSPEQALPSAPSAAAPPIPSAPALESVPPPAAAPFDWSASAPAPTPASTPAPAPEPIALQPVERSAPPPSAFATDPTPTPSPAPPATLSFGSAPQPAPAHASMPSFSGPSAAFGGDAASPAAAAFGGDDASSPSTQEVLARLAKPAPAPATSAPRPPRSNKVFLIAAAALVVVMTVIGVVFLRHPKDLKQMTDLDDGRARLGAEPVDDASHPPMIKPRPIAPAAPSAAPNAVPNAAPSPSPAAPPAAGGPSGEAAQAGTQANLDAAVAMVKDFPLDGERGTVAQLLQFSYTASPDAGKETWSASETADKTYLVEYRFTPAHGGADAHYLFEADMDRGFVIGKNLDAQNMLAGGPRGEVEKPKAKAKRKKKAARRAKARGPRPAAEAQPKDVPLLPLPEEGELRPPAEDDGAFGSDTVNSGL